MARRLPFAAVLFAGLLGFVGARTTFAQAVQPSQKQLQLTFAADGTVDLDAQNVTVREILFEWAHQCGCLVVNGDRLSNTPITMPVQFKGQSQKTVLDSLLRTAPGYVLTPRGATAASVSNYEMIYIVAATSAPVSAPISSPIAAVTSQPMMPTPGSPNDEIPPVQPPGIPGAMSAQGANGPPRPTSSTPTFVPVPIVPIYGSNSSSTSSSSPQPATAPAPGQPTSVPTIPGQPTGAPPIPGQPMPVPVPAPGQPIIR